jgi:hypothetical protein
MDSIDARGDGGLPSYAGTSAASGGSSLASTPKINAQA